MRYVNLTPRWTEILTTWRKLVEQVTAPSVREPYRKVMPNFWKECERMALGADRYNDLIAYLRKFEDFTDESIDNALREGQKLQEIERSTVKESQDDLPVT